MSDNQGHFTLYGKSPFLQLIISLVVILFVGLVLMTVMILAGVLIFGLDLKSISGNLLVEAGGKNINFLRYLAIMQDISLFIIPAIMIRNLMKPDSLYVQPDLGKPRLNEIGLVVILAFCLFPITGFMGLLNSEMSLPEWMSGVEHWMKEKEADADQLIDLLITSDTFGVMMLNIAVIAVFPAISEELIFRGVFQKIFCGFFRSVHPAILITAFLFSALHLQFYGFVPRFILGLVYGYLFFWGGTLWLPVIAHFINNAVPVIGSYIQGWGTLKSGPDPSLWTQIIILPLSLLTGTIILLYFRNKSKKNSDPGKTKSQLPTTDYDQI